MIGKYAIQRELGRGGMGVVYLATDTDLDREVALKMVQPSLARDDRSLARFKKEARAVAALSHPNIVHINALTEIDGALLIEMPFLPQGSLRDVSRGALSSGIVASILDSILDALGCCHDSGIIHRDVKPSNILFDGNGVPKLSDFGAVALLESDWAAGQGERTMTLSFSGTPQYCCPEAWDGQPPSPRWDLYALGMVARELLEGETDRPLSSPLSHIRQLLESEEVPIRELIPNLSAPFGALLDQLCARDPEKRPQSAVEAQSLLRDTPEYRQAANSDARTIDLGRALRSGQPKLPSTRSPWTRHFRRALGVTPWVLVGVFGLLTIALALNRTEAPASSAPETRESRRATAPPPIQQDNFQQGTPDAAALVQLVRESVAGRSAIYTMRAAGAPGEEASFIIRNAPEGGTVAVMGILNTYLHCLTLTPGAEGAPYTVSGFAGDYAIGGAPVLRLARVRGEAHWSGLLTEEFWLQLSYMSELAQEDWTEAVLASPHTGELTDTELIVDWESHPVAMPFLFRELSPRFPLPLAPALEMLPAVANSRIAAELGQATRDVAGVESLEATRALFSATLPGRPFAAGSWLTADRDDGTFRVVMGVPGESPSGIDLCVLPRYGVPLEESPYLHLAMHDGAWSAVRVNGAERVPIAGGWTAEVLARPDGHLVVITLGTEALYWGGNPGPGEWHRLNALVEQGGDGEFVHHEWGWPEIGAVRHGVLLELEF
jgi:serine/threonine protein kinase